MMKQFLGFLPLLLFVLFPLGCRAQSGTQRAQAVPVAVRHQVMLRTTKGDIVLELYNETPLHRDNFLKLVRSGYYDSNLWHRVIADFMIQTGDSTTRHAAPGVQVGDYDPGYTVPAEFRFPKYFHKRGAVAAAREADSDNPERWSSSSQFYIVWGRVFTPEALDWVQKRLDERTDGKVKLTPEVRACYEKEGGTPHLDGQYTVFGEVVQGLDVVDSLNHVSTDANDRPLQDVRIIKAEVIR